jgi:hypothetical protein
MTTRSFIMSLSLDPRYDDLLMSFQQLEALLDVATSIDLTELKSETMTNYFWIINDVLCRAKKLCESLSDIPVANHF